MADVLFTHSYFLHFDAKEFKAMMPYPPLGTLYAASAVRQHGYSVALFDSMLARREDEILQAIEIHRPKLVVIYDDDFNYLSKMCLSRMRIAAFRIASVAKKAGAIVIAHGSDSADHLDDYFTHGVDYILFGESEQSLKDIVDHLLKEDCSLDSIPGLAYIQHGVARRTAKRDVVQDLDMLPFPAWDLVDTDKYKKIWLRRHGYYSLNMVTTRGCPFGCNWCAKPIYGRTYNARSPANVVQEMKFLKSTVKPDHLWFCDDIFGLKPGWIDEFCREVRRQDAAIPFKCLMRVDLLLRDGLMFSLRDAGCTSIWVGAESGSQKILDAMDKGTTVRQIYEAAKQLKMAGIRVGFFIQFGYPGETQEDIDLTLKMLRDCKPDEIGISVSYPLPGTRFYDNVRQRMGDKHNWSDSQDLDLMFPGTFSPDFYRALHKVTHKRFRIWQGIDLLKGLVMRPVHTRHSDLRQLAAMAYHVATLPIYSGRLRTLAKGSSIKNAAVRSNAAA
jgi:anaerobic magnesium-protoporphyrin IX monomethyl ester cyclase